MIKKSVIKENYTVIPRLITFLAITPLAKVVYIHIYGLPNDWNVSQTNLAKVLRVSRQTINTTIKELKAHKLLKIEKHKSDKYYYTYVLLLPTKEMLQDNTLTDLITTFSDDDVKAFKELYND